MVYYPTPLHLLRVYAGHYGSFPAAEQAANEVLSLPIWPQMDEAIQDRVIEGVRRAVLRDA